MPVTGDLTRNKSVNVNATDFAYTKVPVEEFADINSVINQPRYSGKKDGAGALGSDYAIYIATGDTPEAEWVNQTTGDRVTPAEQAEPEE